MFGINDSKIGIDLDGGIGFMNAICALWEISRREFNLIATLAKPTNYNQSIKP